MRLKRAFDIPSLMFCLAQLNFRETICLPGRISLCGSGCLLGLKPRKSKAKGPFSIKEKHKLFALKLVLSQATEKSIFK